MFSFPHLGLHARPISSDPRMAGTRHIDFSSGLTYYDTKQLSAHTRRESVISTDLSTCDEVDLTHHQPDAEDREKEVKVIVLRDRSGLSLALTKLKCCGELQKQKSNLSFSAPGCCDSCEKCQQVGSKKNRTMNFRLLIIFAGLGGRQNISRDYRRGGRILKTKKQHLSDC